MRPPENANAVRARDGAAETKWKLTPLSTASDFSLQDVFDWLPLPSGKALRWLLDRGAPFDSLYTVKAAWVRFDGAGFDFEPGGDPALIFKCEDRGETIDLAAWSARTNKLATWRHAAFALGDVDQCFNPATWFDGGGLHIHADPLDWLRAGQAGIVILKPELCWGHLRHVPRVICSNDITAGLVHKHTRAPRCSTKIFVQAISKEGIAA
jgi:hypothetical protein